MKDYQNIWNKTLDILKNEITEVSYNTWIKSIEPKKLHGNILILEIPNEFNKNILENRYISILENSLKQVCGREITIEFIITGENGEYDFNDNNINFVNKARLNPKYTFSEFVIGNSNRFAHAAALAVAEAPAQAYNPLFIYGGVGLGKTHLMHAIGNFINQNNKQTKIVYVTSEKFTNELINSIRDNKNESFRNKYRTVDVLLVDDIQFIAGKEKTQEEFFHTFNALHEANKQIILSSDRPPKEIPTLEDRLRSRFEWGLISDIQPPDYETRIAILRKKAERESTEIDNQIHEFIAKNIKSNIRELEGALTKVIAFANLSKSDITMELAAEALKDIVKTTKPQQLNYDTIKKVVAHYYNVKVSELNSKKRTRAITYPRQIAMYLCRELTDMSLPKIGEVFGGRDHTTVMHACDKINNDLKENENLAEQISQLTEQIKQEQ